LIVTDVGHIPVLSKEVVELLNPCANDVIVDLTVGRGGHAVQLANSADNDVTMILFDLDLANLEFATAQVEAQGVSVIPIHANFATAAANLKKLGIKADCVLADLGFASNQMDNPSRGLSFSGDGPLDMRLDTQEGGTAAELIQSADEKELADIIFQLGEEPYARRIARKIVQERIVRDAYGPRARTSRLNPATRTFMALRIAVNGELAALDALLTDVKTGSRTVDDGWLSLGARLAVISFHSLEDRRVKQSFVGLEKSGLATRLTRKPLRATEEEIASNPRSRPAKLRAVQLLSEVV